MESLIHSDLSFAKELLKYSFESKMCICQIHASKIMNGSEVDMKEAIRLNLMPWEIEAFTLFSIIYNDSSVNKRISESEFAYIITQIRNYWHPELSIAEKNGVYPEIFAMISLLQQSPVQGLFLQKLFRYRYLFTFNNDKLDLKKIFEDKYDVPYTEYEEFAFALFLLNSRTDNIPRCIYETPDKLMKVYQREKVLSHLSIFREKYEKEIRSFYKGREEDYYYGLKLQYIWPLIIDDGYYYNPSPYLVINAITESMINQLTEGNNALRSDIGKEALESYLYDIVKELPTITWVSKEKEYWVDKNRHLTSDVLVGEEDFFTFYDTKSLSPSIKIRQFNKKEIEHNIDMYADAIKEIYYQVYWYERGKFSLDKDYKKENIYGVAVVQEDSFVSRDKIYNRVFEKIAEDQIDITTEERDYIHSHIKVVSLNQVEKMILQNTSFLVCLKGQVDNKDNWDDLNFVIPTIENGMLSIYEEYTKDLKNRVRRWLQT